MTNTELEQSYLPFQCMIISNLSRYNVEGVATAQYYLLDILATQGSKTTKELAELRGVSQSGISKLTKRLLDKGYVVQERSTLDRRSYDISITKAGKAFLARSASLRHEVLETIESALEPEEIDAFASLCRKIVAYGKESEGEGR